ncbi:programmed cell death protein 1 isoform X1 [Chlorocebus sabaeus]|uniref:programmed cell death protein 1 isoform X1 n=1 Tax=Chlorocebus sabaeus TaxID=60711 RepID=UPI00045E1104|nr:programmed cell death protein 1 isoform X1 [Chlorocebus sabaeus]
MPKCQGLGMGSPQTALSGGLASTGKGVKTLRRKSGGPKSEPGSGQKSQPHVEGRGSTVGASARPGAAEAPAETSQQHSSWAGPSRALAAQGMWAGGRGGFVGPPSPFLTSLHLSESPDRPWNPPTFSPALLLVTEGDNATFTCSFSNASESFVLNWYRMSPSNQTDKLAAFPEDRSQPCQDCRFRVTQLPNGRDFHMSVVRARRNDSGTYLCGAISLAPKAQIKESLRAELRVTERRAEVPTAHPSPSPRPAGQFQALVVGVVGGLLGSLVLLVWVLAVICSRAAQGTIEARRTGQPLKEDPSAVPVFSVDYGELDFQWREKTPEPPVPCVPEQTEYATIVFPGGLGTSSLARRGSADGPRSPRPLRPEDGHCSWPL